MSNRLFIPPISLSAIPNAASSDVPADDKYYVGPARPSAVAANRWMLSDKFLAERPQVALFAQVLTSGSHTAFIVTVEASVTGTPSEPWYRAHLAVPETASIITRNAISVGLVSAAALAGVVLPNIVGGFPFYRFGIAGNNVAANGTARIGMQFLREV